MCAAYLHNVMGLWIIQENYSTLKMIIYIVNEAVADVDGELWF